METTDSAKVSLAQKAEINQGKAYDPWSPEGQLAYQAFQKLVGSLSSPGIASPGDTGSGK